MRKSLTLLGGVITLLSYSSSTAAPLSQKTTAELLGLKSNTTQQFAPTGAAVSPTKAPRSYALKTTDGTSQAEIVASVVYPDNAQGMWSYNLTDWSPRQLAIGIVATGGGFAAGDSYYFNRYLSMMGFEEMRKFSYKLSDWTENDSYSATIAEIATTMAYSTTRDEAYGCFINAERTGYNFVEWNYEYFATKRIVRQLDRPWSGCAFNSEGILYAIERNGDLYTVDLSNGEMTLVGSTGIESNLLSDATIDPSTNTMYWCVCNEDAEGNAVDFGLYAVNLSNASASKLYNLANEEQLCGMYVPEAPKNIPSAAPAASSSSISASFSGSSLSGNISFYTPRYTAGGELMDNTTPLSYTIRANGKEIATGDCVADGRRTTVPVTMEASDSYYFTVTTSNEAGESAPKGTHKFVGVDTPAWTSSARVTPTLSGEQVSLTWNVPSSTGVRGGNIDYTEATYRVVRYPDMKVLAEAATSRTLTDELPSPEIRTDYTYGVTATVNGKSTAELKSGAITLGPITPPYEGTFTTTLATAGWTIIDVAGDDYKWKVYTSDKALQLEGRAGFDDWAITPAVKVRAGTSYAFSITVGTSAYADDQFEVMWGTAPTAEAMTNSIIAPTTQKSSTATTYEGEIAAKETGIIYIGIHGMTPSPSYRINVTSVKIADGLTAAAPAAPTNFTGESPVDGTRSATISFNAPTVSLSGDDLTGELACTSISLLRDGDIIATFTEGLADGAEITYTDEADDLTFGKHLYSAIASNAYGDGPAAEAEVLVGARKPVAPTSAKMTEDGNTGKVTISWDAVTTDVEGNTFSADAVTYRVINRQSETVADKVSGTSVTLTEVEEGTQAFCQYAVYAVTPGGESDGRAATAYKPVGTPYSAPWSESFKNRTVSSIFGFNYINGTEPWQFVSTHEWGFGPQDNDGGFTFLESYGTLTALVTGKISLEGITSPAFTYYTYNYPTSWTDYPTNTLTVEVDNGDGNGFVQVQKDVVSKTGPFDQWNKVVVPLDDFDNETVIIRIVPGDTQIACFTLDNLSVSSHVPYNLTAGALTAPNVADAGKPFELSFTVTNTGEEAIASYEVELWLGDEPVEVKPCERIESNTSMTVTFEQTLTSVDGEYADYKAVIVCDNDHVEADNTSETRTVGILLPAVPEVTDLIAGESPEGAELTWSQPDLSTAAGDYFTETFENAESWSNTVSGWKFIDEDQIPVGGINMANFPCTGLQSWFVVNNTLSGIQEGTDPSRWNARSGQQFIASEYVMRSQVSYQSDDWAITPMLYQGSQAISLYAKSFDANYLESFEVLASAGTTNISDFVAVGSVIDVPNAWTSYRFKLPAGTKYAAIRSRSYDRYFLFVDDVTFIPADAAPAALKVTGYNVYRNGVKLNTTPITEPRYTDATAIEGRDYRYFVTTVYDKGESRPSNEVALRLSDVDGIGAAANLTITAGKGMVTVSGLTEGSVTVTSADGRIVAQAEAQPVVRISLPTGVYIVAAGNKTSKIAVK